MKIQSITFTGFIMLCQFLIKSTDKNAIIPMRGTEHPTFTDK